MIRFYTLIVYPDVWVLYEKVHMISEKSKRKPFAFKVLLEAYEKRLYGAGSYIGHGAVFIGKPCFPHGIYGIFISSEASIGSNCVIFHQVTIGSNRLKGNTHFGSPTLGSDVYKFGNKILTNQAVQAAISYSSLKILAFKDMCSTPFV